MKYFDVCREFLHTITKVHLLNALITNCNSIFSRVAVDQIDSLRRHLLHKEEELKHLNKQFEYQEIEKIKIVKKLAQVEQDLDIKSHDLMKVKSQLGDKEDTLDVSGTLYLLLWCIDMQSQYREVAR